MGHHYPYPYNVPVNTATKIVLQYPEFV